ncbi:MAG: DNA internalization-related competence protein ComEC/Rec2, partial [Myxococcota bacterium]
VGRLPGAGERFSIRRAAAAGTVPFVVGFCVWVGAPPSAVRATVMACAFLIGLVIGRPNTAANALGAAGLSLLAIDPMSLYDAGFLLSFSAAAALALVPSLPPARHAAHKVRRAVIVGAVASLVATLATAPVTAYHFGQVSLVAPITNLVAVPIGAGLAAPLSLLAITAGAVAPWIEPLFVWPLDLVLTALDSIAVAAAHIGVAALDVPRPTALEISAYVALLLAGAASVRHRPARYILAAAALILTGSILWRVSVRSGDGTLVVRFPYVGQGDAAVITLPEGGVVVVDAGGALQPGDWDPGRGVVAPLLRRLGIGAIDLAVVTHPHPDHIGGFAYLAQHFPISELWWNGDAEHSQAQRELVARVKAGGGVTRIAASLPRRTTMEGVEIEVLHPRPGDDAEGLPYFPELNANDNSIVLRVSYGERSILLAGDIEADSEARLAPILAQSDILKSPHHGSRTSSTRPLLDALQVRAVVISCGEDNRFGFPNPDVLANYREYGIEILRTDTDGMVELETSGSEWLVHAHRGRVLRLR